MSHVKSLLLLPRLFGAFTYINMPKMLCFIYSYLKSYGMKSIFISQNNYKDEGE